MYEIYMKRAIELSKKGIGTVNPNPLVGAVIVKNGRILGEGYHKRYGDAHAEINAFYNAKEDVKGGTMYVTLEPCSHYGKTPPCVNAIIKKGIKKVVIGMKDPNPLVSGRGIQILKEHGIEVIFGVLEEEIKKLNEIFIHYITTHSPFCILKTAMTLDGKIATIQGDSKWISNEQSRKFVHKIRNQVSAIMVGIGTVLADNPSLTTRLENKQGKDPLRIIVDSSARIPLEAKVLHLSSKAKTLIATTQKANPEKIKVLEDMGVEVMITPLKNNQVDLKFLMDYLGKRGVDSVLIEGGATLNFSALEERIVNKVFTFISPKMIGGEMAKAPIGGRGKEFIKDAFFLQNRSIRFFEEDLMIEGYMRKEE
ncbi:bifunctional diaminohydroxyphosphoribosylaminopyrimidine deaminase/5-amino-6-(5-phosphoribosylamino)uracil reductase RibD [Garciella nitratireducens]|uniref:Riboflavin biosynthesis protein RibD n=1 Tax=Garciella nitratireducens DSM 15102 TaxID=1121911 RepID=A0A1T4LHF3_9FIRM|nr:bifunctional diaminohydroxyphosphoribosylaminopyrimidine deaminase/5-amino-6-(5-phosphoribosylamino)uracil reductase RibD [Garciella nitratireducens]SJZ54145.1 diaminohydroxyphosphoribosylaminopyrimidine deaminase [Garciella nitratireducens DSM 15102]